MKQVDNDKSLIIQTKGLVNFTKFQLRLTDKLLNKEASDWLRRAKIHLQQKDYPKAIDACNEAIDITPEDAVAYRYSAIARMLIGDYADALEDFRLAIQFDPNDL